MAKSEYTTLDIRRAAKTGTPVKYGFLNVYPLTVKDYELLWSCESALTLRLSSLPAIYACKSYAEALFSIAINGENIVQNGDVVARADDWFRFMLLLCESLRIPRELMKSFLSISVDEKDKTRLTRISVRQIVDAEENVQDLSPSDLSNIRKIIAELNGKEIPDESDNAELIQAEIDSLSAQGSKLDINMDSLLASVARDQRCRIKELYDWTIYEFELIRAAIERERRFTVYGIGECGGMVKFPKGNPFPSIFFDRPAEFSGVTSASELSQRLGGAVEEATSIPNLPTITK